MNTHRKFRLRGGFPLAEDYLLWDGQRTVIIFKNNGQEPLDVTEFYPLEYMEQKVAEGSWEELP